MGSEQLEGLVGLLAGVRLDVDAPVQQWRDGYDALGGLAVPVASVRTESVSIGGVPAQRHLPEGADERFAVVHLHGGGYVIGSSRSHAALASHLADALGAPVLVPDYRLAPEHPIGASLDDALAVWDGLLAAGLAAGDLALSGDSAGGGLALRCAMALRDRGGALPAALALQSPWVDLTCELPSILGRADRDPVLRSEVLRHWAALACGGSDPADPAVSPLHADLAGLPPMLVHVGGREVLHDDSAELVHRARAAGVEVELADRDELIHVWHLFAGNLPEADAALDEVAAFLRGHLGAR